MYKLLLHTTLYRLDNIKCNSVICKHIIWNLIMCNTCMHLTSLVEEWLVHKAIHLPENLVGGPVLFFHGHLHHFVHLQLALHLNQVLTLMTSCLQIRLLLLSRISWQTLVILLLLLNHVLNFLNLNLLFLNLHQLLVILS